MLVRVHAHHEGELWRWTLLLALAAALTLTFASIMSGGEFRRPRGGPPLPSMEPAVKRLPATSADRVDLAVSIWELLQLHQDLRFEEAALAWPKLQVPPETQLWKHVALAQAYLATKEFELAAEELERATRLESRNAVVHYHLGLLYLERADRAEEWHDALEGRPGVRLVGSAQQGVVPNTRSMYKLVAAKELEKAIAAAELIRLDQPLLPAGHGTAAALEPTVGDLLLALGADRFAAKAHHVLSSLYLERGVLELAEEHMDAASAGGLAVVYGYQDLAREYEQRGQYRDAARALRKSATQRPGAKAAGWAVSPQTFSQAF